MAQDGRWLGSWQSSTVSSEPSAIGRFEKLCGRPGGPSPTLPRGMIAAVRRLGAEIDRRSAAFGRRVTVDPVALLVERAEAANLRRRGPVSCGGTARMVRATDGWLAVNLARPDDWDLVDAWLEPQTAIARGRWDAVADAVGGRAAQQLVDRSTLLGLPVGRVGERYPVPEPGGTRPPTIDASGMSGVHSRSVPLSRLRVPRPTGLDGMIVVDLSALWAGPLAGNILRRAGARVVKVESSSRPDGARRGPPDFFRSLNQGKESVSLDFDTAGGRSMLRALVRRADIVISAARPRAFRQLGLVPDELVGAGGPRLWLSITGYGASERSAGRVAFGDDAAAAGGIVVWDEDGPCFCGDAVADPLSGMAAAAAALGVLDLGGGWVVEVSMADVAAGCRDDAADLPDRPSSAAQDHRSDGGPAEPAESLPDLGAHTVSVLSDLGIC